MCEHVGAEHEMARKLKQKYLTLQVEAPDPTGGGQEQDMVASDQQVRTF